MKVLDSKGRKWELCNLMGDSAAYKELRETLGDVSAGDRERSCRACVRDQEFDLVFRAVKEEEEGEGED